MPPQSKPPIGKGFGGGDFNVETDLQQVTQFLLRFLLADLFIVLVAVQESQSDILRVRRTEDELQHAARNIDTLFGK